MPNNLILVHGVTMTWVRDHAIPYNGPTYGKQISANQESYNVTLTVIADAACQARAVPRQSTTLHRCEHFIIALNC
jgi:hypothetical protein